MFNPEDITLKEVSCVISVQYKDRVSQWYSREGDAIRKAKYLNASYRNAEYVAVTGKVVDFRLCKGTDK